mgnify:CR=1 FL=1
MNKVVLSGNLAKDVDMRMTQSGKAVASFSLAVSDGWGENKKTYFVPIVVWGKMAELCEKYLRKGSKAMVDGRLQVRSYETQDGSKRWVTEVIANEVEFLGSRSQSEGQAGDHGFEGTSEEIPF